MKTCLQFVKFGLIGVLNSVLHYLVFLFLFRIIGMEMVVSSALGYMAGVINSFLMNRRWTFNHTGFGAGSEFAKFVIVNIVSLGANIFTLELFVSYVGIIPEIAQVIAICCTLVINFSGNKWWTFRRRAPESGELNR